MFEFLFINNNSNPFRKKKKRKPTNQSIMGQACTKGDNRTNVDNMPLKQDNRDSIQTPPNVNYTQGSEIMTSGNASSLQSSFNAN